MKKKAKRNQQRQTGKRAINRTYKSTVFIMLFEDKKNLLELYNAVSGKHYQNPELLEINTLENAIYLSVKNDVSFVIDARLSLYEHQSTYSPNLPLRFLFYISSEYSVMTREANIYGTQVVRIPPPQFIIFYNGEKEQPERKILKLSDMYTVQEGEICLELTAVMLNINQGFNEKLKETCKTLGDYAEYTGRVRKYARKMGLPDAVERAITECIQEGIMREFLEKNRAEVTYMSIFEYDQERHLRQEREEAYETGRKEGFEEGSQAVICDLIRKMWKRGKSIREIAEDLEADQTFVEEIVKRVTEQET